MRTLLTILFLFSSPLFSKEIDGLSIAFTSPEGTTDKIMIRPEMNMEAYVFEWSDMPQPAIVGIMFPDFKYWEERGTPEPSFDEWIEKELKMYYRSFNEASFRDSEFHILDEVVCGDFKGYKNWFMEKEEEGVQRIHLSFFLTDGHKKMKVNFRGPKELQDTLWDSLNTIKTKANNKGTFEP